jgi:hypothetical protein
VVSISKVTSDVVRKVAPDVEEHYLPHAVDMEIFKKLPDEIVTQFKNTEWALGIWISMKMR